MLRLNNKVAVVTGGGSGIGKAISILFAQQGATVFILDIDQIGANDAIAEIYLSGGIAYFIKCNVTDEFEVISAIESIIRQASQIDIIVNNAGIAHVGNVENTSNTDLERLISVNIKGVFYVVKSAVAYLRKTQGVILNISSIAATVGLQDRFAYSLTKGAVLSMTLSIAKDYLKYGIRCNCISPGRVHTPFVDGFLEKNYPGKESEIFQQLSKTQPIGRMGTSAEIATLSLYLCSTEAAFITGSDYLIDGGLSRLNT